MGLPQQTTTNPTEKPSTSETTTSDAVQASDVSNQTSSLGATDPTQLAGGAMGGSHGSAEEAADKLYEERMEEEYAKREGGA